MAQESNSVISEDTTTKSKQKILQSTLLIELTHGIELFHNDMNEAYARVEDSHPKLTHFSHRKLTHLNN